MAEKEIGKGGTNRLINEKSPYLLQHARNPVDWYPWGEEAFERARVEDKPVFLSIGYSSCHWCHVMNRESFSDPQIASMLNDLFICVKIDREERPDLDEAYMQVCQVITGSGGWPLTVILTPDKKPFFASTYIPRNTKGDLTGLLDLIPSIRELWEKRREEVRRSADQFAGSLRAMSYTPSPGTFDQSLVKQAYDELKDQFDTRYGGFGTAPKFPSPHLLLFLLHYWKRSGDDEAMEMIKTTLSNMAHGGIFDQIGYGFHRYSTDSRWFIPHFEKMLYDQALLIMAYTGAYLATHVEEYRCTAIRTADYVLRELTSGEGAFFSSEDADSDGEDGAYYTWRWDEMAKVLESEEQMAVAAAMFGISHEGNTREMKGMNILHLRKNEKELADELGYDPSAFETIASAIRSKLAARRASTRQHPLKDDKILADWNGLMIAAFAVAGRAFEEERFVAAAVKAASFVMNDMRKNDGGIYHRYRGGEAAIDGFADDYTCMQWGLIELYETTFDARYLGWAIELDQYLAMHFVDKDKGGLFTTSEYGESLFWRRKEGFEGAYPSANSVYFVNSLKLALLTGRSYYSEQANRTAQAFSGDIAVSPSQFAWFLTGIDYLEGRTHEIIIAGNSSAGDTKEMIRAMNTHFIPDAVILLKPVEEGKPAILEHAPFLENYPSIDNKATAYVCNDHTCRAPVTDAGKVLDLLDAL